MNQVTIPVFNNVRLDAGQIISSEPRAAPEGLAVAGVSAVRMSWPETEFAAISVWIDLSYDGGQSWVLGCEFGAHGGESVDSSGRPAPRSSFMARAPKRASNILFKVSVQAMIALTTTIEAHFQ